MLLPAGITVATVTWFVMDWAQGKDSPGLGRDAQRAEKRVKSTTWLKDIRQEGHAQIV